MGTAGEVQTAPGDSDGQHLVFALGDGAYTVAMAPVREIIRVPEVTPVPLSHDAVIGAVNLRGQVIPVADLRQLLGYPAVEPGEDARVLVTSLRDGLGLLVDAVLEATVLDPGDVRPAENVTGVVDLPWLEGVVHRCDRLVQCVDLERLIANVGLEIVTTETLERSGGGSLGGTAEQAETAGQRRELIGLDVAGQTFALPLRQVVEILREPEVTTAVPDGPPAMLGIADWRDRPLPLLDLARYFDLPEHDGEAERRVLVVPLAGDRDSLDGAVVGLVADAAREVLRVPAHRVDPLPEIMRQGGGLQECSAVGRLEDGRLVSVLDAEQLLHDRDLAAVLNRDDVSGAADDPSAVEQFVTFELAGRPYGVPIDAVKEILRPPERLTRVPRAPALVEGALNLRGSILPIIGLRDYLGLGPVPDSERARVLVLRRESGWLGFGVDAVLSVEQVARASIAPAPGNATRHTDLLTRVAMDDNGGMTLLLDPAGLAARVEAAAEEVAMANLEPQC
ncbi:chemotaxis protein CheW [Aquisalimonas sp.]|uniref:chemotaxis protein CheW n=1 Tax=unclassified Aquisalimonas TaxID=2644645 RepID=UPI0025C0A0F2|nr:chemotaxis protein CheW [Aquisalimonas sp.]